MAQVAVLHPARLWKRYNSSLRSSPLMTKSITSCVAYALGDGIAQVVTCKAPSLEKRVRSIDALRMARLALFGFLWSGPSSHTFYKWLDKAFRSMAFGRIASIAGKVGVDQLCYSPVCTIAFLAWVNAACLTPEKIPTDISQKLFSTTKNSWQLWIPVMTLNMALVPAQSRFLFINLVTLFWTYKMSTMSAAAPECEADILAAPIDADPVAAPASVEEILADVSSSDYAAEETGQTVSVTLPLLEQRDLVLTVDETTSDAPTQDSEGAILSVGIHQDVEVALT